jgi:leucine dehydrogenase
MRIFEEMEARDHEELIFNYFEDVDLKLIISLHDTTSGRTIGGLMMNQYESDMEAIVESLRLSQIMTYQSATADVDCGGANALIIGDPKTDKNEAFFRAAGRFIESFKGKIFVSPGLSTETKDFKYIQRETDYTIFEKKIDDSSKPTAEITANGVYWGIKACAKMIYGTSDLSGLSFTVQGVGNIGKYIVDYLKQEKTEIFISDLVYDNIKAVEDKYHDINILRPNEVISHKTDFLVPCAVGRIINEDNIKKLNCKVIAGSAYNVFTDEKLIEAVYKRDILYAPVFLIAAGDLFLLDKNLKLDIDEIGKKGTRIIYDLLLNILQRASDMRTPPYEVAKADAMNRYKKIDQIKNILC